MYLIVGEKMILQKFGLGFVILLSIKMQFLLILIVNGVFLFMLIKLFVFIGLVFIGLKFMLKVQLLVGKVGVFKVMDMVVFLQLEVGLKERNMLLGLMLIMFSVILDGVEK